MLRRSCSGLRGQLVPACTAEKTFPLLLARIALQLNGFPIATKFRVELGHASTQLFSRYTERSVRFSGLPVKISSNGYPSKTEPVTTMLANSIRWAKVGYLSKPKVACVC